MGGSTSKQEEVIITQAGNSGGISTNTNHSQVNGYSLWEIIGIVVVCMAIAIVVLCIWKKMQKSLKNSIRREIARSRENVV